MTSREAPSSPAVSTLCTTVVAKALHSAHPTSSSAICLGERFGGANGRGDLEQDAPSGLSSGVNPNAS